MYLTLVDFSPIDDTDDQKNPFKQKTCLLLILHYIDQICARVAGFTVSSLTVHRFLIASIAVSSKALCDVFCTNSFYAKVGGVRVMELNVLEKELLAAIDWRLTVRRRLFCFRVADAMFVRSARASCCRSTTSTSCARTARGATGSRSQRRRTPASRARARRPQSTPRSR